MRYAGALRAFSAHAAKWGGAASLADVVYCSDKGSGDLQLHGPDLPFAPATAQSDGVAFPRRTQLFETPTASPLVGPTFVPPNSTMDGITGVASNPLAALQIVGVGGAGPPPGAAFAG